MRIKSRKDIEIRKNTINLFLFILIILAIPPTILLLENKQNISSQAAEGRARRNRLLESVELPDYLPEILISFKEDPNISGSFDLRSFSTKKRTKFSSVNKTLENSDVENITELKEGIYILTLPVEVDSEILETKKKYSQPLFRVRTSEDPVLSLVEELEKDPNVAYVSPNYIAETFRIPDDERFGEQWGLESISAPQAWDISIGDEEVIIAILDLGTDLDHPDLFNKLLPGYDFINDDPYPEDQGDHGVHLSGIAAAETFNQIGVAGVCPGCLILPVKVCERGCPQDAVIRGIDFAVENGAAVINLSLGGVNYHTPFLEEAINNAVDSGVLVVASAGNYGRESIVYPAYYEKVIGVTSLAEGDRWDIGTYHTWVDISAPGVNILSTINGGEYGLMSGTSMSAPHVAGVIGLLRSQFPNLPVKDIRAKLEMSADDIYEINPEYYGKLGSGKVNANKAVRSGDIVLNARLISPGDDTFIAESTIDITGTISGTVPTEYSLGYAKDGEGVWLTEGIELPNGSTYQVEEGLIGRWNLESLEDGIYILGLKVKDRDTREYQASDYVQLGVYKGLIWVYEFEKYPYPFVIGDLEADDDLETVVTTRERIYIVEPDGTKIEVADINAFHPRSVLGDLDNDNDLEILTTADFQLYAFHHDGSVASGDYPVTLEGKIFGSIMLGDLEGDGSLDVITFTRDDNTVDTRGVDVYVWESDGELKGGWPYRVENAQMRAEPALGDLDGDGNLEIVFSLENKNTYDGEIHVLSHTGELFGDWPYINYGSKFSSPSLGDINNDGDLEIIVADSRSPSETEIFVFNHDKEIADGWPTRAASNVWSVSLADLDRNDFLEIVYTEGLSEGGRISVYDYQAQPFEGWPINFSSEWTAEASGIADINGDGKPDIIVGTSAGNIRAFDAGGGEIPLSLNYPSYITDVAPADIDNDNKVDIVASTFDKLFAWELDSVYSPDADEWPQFRHDMYHTGMYTPKTKADLEVGEIRLYVGGEEKTPKAGEESQLRMVVTNKGDRKSGEFHYEWSINDEVSARELALSIAPKESAEYTYDWVAESGELTFRFVADSASEISESDEDNNIAVMSVFIPGLEVSKDKVELILEKDYSSSSNLTMKEGFTLTSTGASGWQLKNNQDATYTDPGGNKRDVLAQGFGFYESSGGIVPGQSVTVRAYVNNSKDAGVYQGSYTLQQLISGRAKDIMRINYILTVEEPKKADLKALRIKVLGSNGDEVEPVVGEKVELVGEFRNIGDKESGEFYIEWWKDSQRVERYLNRSVAADADRVNTTHGYSWVAEKGTHNFEIKLDPPEVALPNGRVDESDEENNNTSLEVIPKEKKGVVNIRAKGSSYYGQLPRMGIRIDGKYLGNVNVPSNSFKDYKYEVEGITKDSKVDVIAVNGSSLRKLGVDYVEVVGERIEAESDEVTYDLGSGSAAYDGKDFGRKNIVSNYYVDMDKAGALRFNSGSDKPGEDTIPPDVNIISPKHSETLSGQVIIKAEASDNIMVSKVEFQINTKVVGTDPTSPYEYAWDTTKEQNIPYSLWAIASDQAGNVKKSALVIVSVDNKKPPEPPLPPREEKLKIVAKGDQALWSWPNMMIRVEEKYIRLVGNSSVMSINKSEYTEYTFVVPGIKQTSKVDVQFINDASYWWSGQDRNLYIDYIEVGGKKIEAEAASVSYDRGSSNQAFDGKDVVSGREKMEVNGALRFNQ